MLGTAPYKQVLTHGFFVDAEGKKMSKSLGNTVAPEQIFKQYGADILRLAILLLFPAIALYLPSLMR